MAGCAALLELRVKLSDVRDSRREEDMRKNVKIQYRRGRAEHQRGNEERQREGHKSIRNVLLKSSAGIRDDNCRVKSSQRTRRQHQEE